MKSSGQRKRKALGVSLKGNEVTGSPEKNCAKRNCKRREKPAEECKSCLPENHTREKPSSNRQSAGEKLLHGGQCRMDTTGVQDLKLKNGDTSSPFKIKLQLFPINSTTHLKLEKDGHNPFLELTLSLRKKISSVIKHLNSKWGSSNATLDELVLFPYDVRLERINSCSRWTANCGGVTAGEVHAALGSPTIFRLRYGWVSNLHVETSGISFTSMAVEEQSESENIGTDCNGFSNMTCDNMDKVNIANQEIRNLINIDETEDVAMTEQMPLPISGDDVNASLGAPWDDSLTSLSIGGLLSEASLLNKIKNSTQKSESKSNLQPIELVSDISVGALLSEASLLNKINNPEDRSENKLSLLITQSESDICTGGILCNASLQSKSNNFDLKTENEAGCQLIHLDSQLSIGGLMSEASLQRNTNGIDIVSRKMPLGLKSSVEKGALPSRSLFPWDDDSSISLSIGGLLCEASLQARFDGCDSKLKPSTSVLLSRLPTLDSSEVSAAAQHITPLLKQPLHESFSSILDAEETCHAFSFKKVSSLSKDSMTSKGDDKYGRRCNDSKSKTSGSPCKVEVNELALVSEI